MLFSKKNARRSAYFRKDDDEEKEHEDQRERIRFQSYRTHRKTGKRSMIWLLVMFLAVLGLFIYLNT